jgi:hypothetical protein
LHPGPSKFSRILPAPSRSPGSQWSPKPQAQIPQQAASHAPASGTSRPLKVRPRDAAGKARRRVAAELIGDLERIYQRKRKFSSTIGGLPPSSVDSLPVGFGPRCKDVQHAKGVPPRVPPRRGRRRLHCSLKLADIDDDVRSAVTSSESRRVLLVRSARSYQLPMASEGPYAIDSSASPQRSRYGRRSCRS